MPEPTKNRATARCSCGSVELEAVGNPITSVACYCESCQEGSRQIEALPNGRPARSPDGGTAYVLYRKDRVEHPRGSELLRGLKLRDESSTRRVVAACCGSPMFLDFEKGHWLSVYRTALRGDPPPLEMRVHTKSKPTGIDLPNDVPAYAGYSLRFMAKLLTAWIAMLLRRWLRGRVVLRTSPVGGSRESFGNTGWIAGALAYPSWPVAKRDEVHSEGGPPWRSSSTRR